MDGTIEGQPGMVRDAWESNPDELVTLLCGVSELTGTLQ